MKPTIEFAVFDADKLDMQSVRSYQSDFGRRQRLNSANLEGGTEVNKFDFDYYPSDQLKELRLGYRGHSSSAHSILNVNDSGISLNFKFDHNGEVSAAYFSETLISGDIRENKMYNLSGELIVHMNVNVATGVTDFLKSPNPNASGWWDDLIDGEIAFVDELGDCVGDLWSPLDNGIYDTVFVTIAIIETGGWFIPASVVACGIRVALEEED
ncbi:hypothetical protein ACV07N_02175 [Roseivirga echinicomitans]